MPDVNLAEVIAEALAEHHAVGMGICNCGWSTETELGHSWREKHEAHQASVIAALPDIAVVPALPVLADAEALFGLLEHFNFDLGNGDAIPVETANGHCWFAYPTEDGGDFGVALLCQDPRETTEEDEGGYPTFPRTYPDDPIITYPLRVLWLPAVAGGES